jgi:hypothetical protein
VAVGSEQPVQGTDGDVVCFGDRRRCQLRVREPPLDETLNLLVEHLLLGFAREFVVQFEFVGDQATEQIQQDRGYACGVCRAVVVEVLGGAKHVVPQKRADSGSSTQPGPDELVGGTGGYRQQSPRNAHVQYATHA